MDKTVYILGAGFSKELNAPLQSEILREVFSLELQQLSIQERELFFNYRLEFQQYLEEVLFISPGEFIYLPLEDIYTPIDRCILDNVSFRNLNKTKLIDLRQKINALIILLFHFKLRNIPQDSYVQKFAKYLADIKRNQKKSKDTFAIISLNWDIILDNELNFEVKKNDKKDGVVDYCCYVTPYIKGDNIIPGLLAKGLNKYNIKLLKLHGSMNWLQCQRCQRLFVAFDQKIAVEEYVTKPKCRLCERNFQNEQNCFGESQLISQLLMPTLLKDINNVQLKLIWQNAGIELSEATKIVFIGYSFPMADFELRQLLAKFVRHNAVIEVILKDKPNDPSEDCPERRYRSFFGKRSIGFSYEGVSQYIGQLIISGQDG